MYTSAKFTLMRFLKLKCKIKCSVTLLKNCLKRVLLKVKVYHIRQRTMPIAVKFVNLTHMHTGTGHSHQSM